MLGSSQRQQLATIMIARNYQWLIDTNDFAMASITIRHLSAESSGCSLEALARSILDEAARAPVPPTGIPTISSPLSTPVKTSSRTFGSMISRKWWSSCDSSQHQCSVGVDSPIAEPDGCPVAGNKRTIVGIAVDHARGVTLRDRAAPGRAETITPVGILERDSQPLCRANVLFRRTVRGNLR